MRSATRLGSANGGAAVLFAVTSFGAQSQINQEPGPMSADGSAETGRGQIKGGHPGRA